MSIIQLQGESEKKRGIYYEFNDASRPLGEGGMGKVFRGQRKNIHTQEVRDVAIKFIFSGLPPNVIQRARDEAKIKIVNDNLVEMMGFLSVDTEGPNGLITTRYHVVSELLLGVTLSDLMSGKLKDQEGMVIPFAEELYELYKTDREKFAIIIMKKVLAGILALHDAGYIHRDIDPSNIMITRDRKIKIIDFGIAKKVDGLKTNDRNLTVDGQFMGKPHYAAPELILGELKNQNKPTDIYSLGILFYQLITGDLPFNGASNMVMNAHLHTKMPLNNIKNKELRKIVKRATEKDCFSRYTSVAEFRADLDTVSSKKPGFVWNEKRNLIIGVCALAVVGLIILVVALSGRRGKEEIHPTADSVENMQELSIVDMLSNEETAAMGLQKLDSLYQTGDTDATYLLSRLYAQSYKTYNLPEEILKYKGNLSGRISPDVLKSHQLLEEVITKEPDNYKALYDLACDHYNYDSTYGIERNLSKSKQLLDKAYKLAKENNDMAYQEKIKAMLSYF